MNRSTAVPVLFLSLVACEPSSRSLEGIVTTDSAGVTVLHHSETFIRSAPTLTPVEVVRIGTLDGPEDTQFFQLAAAEEVDGEIYALDYGDSRVRVFGSNGEFRRAFGREGSGPGEFRGPLSLYVIGDTVAIQGQRLNIVDTEGTPLATGPGRAFQEDGFLSRTVPTTGGWVGEWITRKSANTPPGVPFRETVTVHPANPLTGELGTAVYMYEMAEQRLAGEIGFVISPFFQARPTHASSPDGRIYYTSGDDYRIDVIDGVNGKVVRRIEGDMTPPPVTRAMVNEAIGLERERVRNAPPGSEGKMYEKVIDDRAALPVPATLPVFGRMYISRSGRLLALRLDLDEDPVRRGNPSVWDLFDTSGRLEGRLTLPVGTTVLRLTDDGLLARVLDELDVHHLVKYRLEAAPPRTE